MSKPAEILRMNDAELVTRAKTGCPQALAGLVRNHHQDLRAFLVRRVGNLATADDLAQDVFLTTLRKIETIADDQCFRAWLFQVARNKSVDYLRRASKEKSAGFEFEELLAEANICRAQNIGDSEGESLLSALRVCISQLNPASRSLIDKFYFQGLSAEKIAKSSRRKSNAVRMAMLRIRKALSSCIRRRIGAEIEL